MGAPVDFPGSNRVLGPPEGVGDQEGVDETQVARMPVFGNGVVCVSCWELSAAERAEVAASGRLYLAVFSGPTQAPVFVGGEDATRELIADYGVWKR